MKEHIPRLCKNYNEGVVLSLNAESVVIIFDCWTYVAATLETFE